MARRALAKVEGLVSRKRQPDPGVSRPNEAVSIMFGHNAADRKVLMYFLPPIAFQIVYSPEEARDVATKLAHYADMADGKKGM